MKQIEHDQNEKRRTGPSMATVLTISIVLGGGLAVARTDWAAVAASDEPWWIIPACLIVAVGFFVSVHYALKGWDRLWARIKGRE